MMVKIDYIINMNIIEKKYVIYKKLKNLKLKIKILILNISSLIWVIIRQPLIPKILKC